mmetsp:Transcript_57588/g.136941  ORF Transcript_57588/g.136941 Transcript_57588/m.136941 type:complete len:140 (-) Transcript_57588:111-530(-)|eukprot:CAMPEP_0178414116 /NCGR_PEP_ID=MMETSP0689_2-20121128/22871_1 /TAXON_ID=160604 /ORGANISM="Amphidinium massartii, Strain CS-259" /LENGTH=139 /DNA_ID=CAMNT_0020035397 /DNA_START=15 /DNA_END=434 /DNA_ORIENTATION=+
MACWECCKCNDKEQIVAGGVIAKSSSAVSSSVGSKGAAFGLREDLKDWQTFTIDIQQALDEKIGLGVNPDVESGGLKVVALQAGTITDWNKRNPESQVCVGDRLVEVNGINSASGNIHLMMEQCKKGGKLTLTFKRPLV